ncbi:protein of unknown function (plasmid) [Paraburkholderia kururiensis]
MSTPGRQGRGCLRHSMTMQARVWAAEPAASSESGVRGGLDPGTALGAWPHCTTDNGSMSVLPDGVAREAWAAEAGRSGVR